MIYEKTIIINGEETQYTIDTIGRVFSKISNKYLKPFISPSGYQLVDIHHNGRGHTLQLHRIVAGMFIPNPDNLPTVNHKDGDKSNNRVSNLEWMSITDNVRHAWDIGLAKPRYGIDNPSNVYTPEQIHEVCQYLMENALTDDEISRRCCVNKTLLRDIKYRGKWKHISRDYNIPYGRKGFKRLRNLFILMIHQGLTNQEIINELDLPDTGSMDEHLDYVREIYRNSLNDYPSDGSTPESQ